LIGLIKVTKLSIDRGTGFDSKKRHSPLECLFRFAYEVKLNEQSYISLYQKI